MLEMFIGQLEKMCSVQEFMSYLKDGGLLFCIITTLFNGQKQVLKNWQHNVQTKMGINPHS